MILVRQEIGEVLRDFRLQKGRTLRQVAGRASVALGSERLDDTLAERVGGLLDELAAAAAAVEVAA